MKIALVIIFVILGVALSAIILMQEGKSQGLGAISGMADTYWSKNKGRSIEGNLEKFTKFAAVAFFAIALILDIIW
ncbi:MAG: preprotein translocase subunit SecG [Oribacterium sp.]